jgi:hypothetical protein
MGVAAGADGEWAWRLIGILAACREKARAPIYAVVTFK